jgi:two-component system cell cycle sensor histidine kinase/response regulator CckA
MQEMVHLASRTGRKVRDDIAFLQSVMQTVIDRDCVCTDVRNQLAMIKTMAGNVAQLARQLLIIAAADGEIVTLVDVRDTILQLVPLIERILGNNNRLQTSIEDRLWPVQGSAETIGEILLPLVTNASEAMPGGGTLFIGARNVTKAQCQAQLEDAALRTDYLLVEVTDDGVGIPEEIMCRVFEPFTTTKGPGCGFGLAKVRHTVRSLNGHIIFQSRAKRGTTFEIFLPQHTRVPFR